MVAPISFSFHHFVVQLHATDIYIYIHKISTTYKKNTTTTTTTTTQCKLQNKCSFVCVHISKYMVGRGKTPPVQVAVGSSRIDTGHVCTLDNALVGTRKAPPAQVADNAHCKCQWGQGQGPVRDCGDHFATLAIGNRRLPGKPWRRRCPFCWFQVKVTRERMRSPEGGVLLVSADSCGQDFSGTACTVHKTASFRRAADFWQRHKRELRAQSRRRRPFGINHILAKTHQGHVWGLSQPVCSQES